ncbi:hypothetical protein HWV62_35144 [Athelia sp. TMB]|nr:hypothetical protein HWV62_35144 [Athelia sp. TMB]
MQRASSPASLDDAHSPPAYRSMASSVPPSYASGSDTASVADPHDRVDGWRRGIPAGSPAPEALSIADTSSAGDSASNDGASSIARRDLYYRVYNEDGAVQSKRWFDGADLSVGRTNANWVAPPSTVASIKRFLFKEEALDDSVTLQLFADSAAPLEDGRILPLMTGSGPGSSTAEALGLKILQKRPALSVQAAAQPQPYSQQGHSPPSATQPTRTRSWLSLPLGRRRPTTATSQNSSSASSLYSAPQAAPSRSPISPSRERNFNIRIKAKWDGEPSSLSLYPLAADAAVAVQVTDPSWLSLRKGEFLVTDGVVKLCEPNGEMVMLVKNAAGEHGYVYRDDIVAR